MNIKSIAVSILALTMLSTNNSYAENNINMNQTIANNIQRVATTVIPNLRFLNDNQKNGWIDRLAPTYANYRYGTEALNNSSWVTPDVKKAWVRGFDGSGVSVAIVDDFGNPLGHGERISTVVGGESTFNGRKYVGLAPNATVNKIDHHAYNIHEAYNSDIVNMSYGHRPVTVTEELLDNLENRGIPFQRYDLATRRVVTDYHENIWNQRNTDALLVRSSGNLSLSCKVGELCNLTVLQLAHSDKKDQTLIVGSFQNGSSTTLYGEKAGVNKNSFVVSDTPWEIVGGTSGATAMVTGQAAIIKSKFDTLSGVGLASVIKSTADDLGEPGVDEIYGHGKINLARALSPIGTIR